jgi:hypothetical protein
VRSWPSEIGGSPCDLGFRTMLWIAAGGYVIVAATLARSPYRGARLGV